MIDISKYTSAARKTAEDIKKNVMDSVRAMRQQVTALKPAPAPAPRAEAKQSPLKRFFSPLKRFFSSLNPIGKKEAPAPAPKADSSRPDSDARRLISDALRAADRRAHDDWAAFLDAQYRKLVAEIEAQPDVSHIDKVMQSESVMTRSVLSFSLVAEVANLRNASGLYTPDGFDAYVASLAERYAQAVDKAINQQVEIYKRLEK